MSTKNVSLAGLTRAECAIECDPQHCVITGGPACGHPFKGGLQVVYQRDPKALERYREARKLLAMDEAGRRSDAQP